MLNAICITTNQLEHIQTNLCIHLSYLENQRNLKIYNKNIFKKKKKCPSRACDIIMFLMFGSGYIQFEDSKNFAVMYFVTPHNDTHLTGHRSVSVIY